MAKSKSATSPAQSTENVYPIPEGVTPEDIAIAFEGVPYLTEALQDDLAAKLKASHPGKGLKLDLDKFPYEVIFNPEIGVTYGDPQYETNPPLTPADVTGETKEAEEALETQIKGLLKPTKDWVLRNMVIASTNKKVE